MHYLPLFPLPNVVLFPGMMLPLRIFEDRYKQMMRDVMAGEARFGIQLCREYDPLTLVGQPFDVGTVAEVMEYEVLADGCMNVLTVGTERFRVAQYDETSHPYLSGRVTWLHDVEEAAVPKKLVEETTDLLQEVFRLMYKILKKEFTPFELPSETDAISFFIAEHLRGSLVLKQELLEMDSVKSRFLFEREVLTKVVKTLAVRSQIEDAFQNF